jgi:hypothetical protein
MENPDTQGKDMDMDDARMKCIKTNCPRNAEPGSRTCKKHDEDAHGHTNTGP